MKKKKHHISEIFETANGKLSAKRIIGIIGSIETFYLAAATQWNPNISETLILGMASACFALIGSSLMEKKHTNTKKLGDE